MPDPDNQGEPKQAGLFCRKDAQKSQRFKSKNLRAFYALFACTQRLRVDPRVQGAPFCGKVI
jgi:hypothetical protein